ncbi:MAG: acetoacetate decarboxylase family protein [Candidatus Heimdallarchaeota archaeon]|nr:acetoacetate decarboxylase family protein [Candidatus Heimdallarchaeota archaeon]MCK4878858.1 acetoacetate decarboxylase family protein [Candidatus Heimdallarchaeota archaeon]
MSLDKDFFNNFEYKHIEFEGEEFEFPVKYFDFLRMTAFFPASARKLKKYLPSKKLKLVKPFPGISLIFIIAFEYRKLANIEPYNELRIGFPVIFKDKKKKYQGTYVIHLPVSTEDSCAEGIEFWGYPKFVADIIFEETKHTQICSLKHENQEVLSLEIRKLDTKVQYTESNSFTVKGSKLLRTVIKSQALSGVNREKGEAILSLGDHPISKELKLLLLRNESVGHRYDPKVQMILPLAEEEYDL